MGASNCLLALEAVAWLAVARLMVMLAPFRRLRRSLVSQVPDSRLDGAWREALVRRIGWALNAAGQRAPWRCKCLERAIAGKLMLGVRGVGSTLYLGVLRPAPDAPVVAHAWLRCGDTPVVGEEGADLPYSVVGSFADAATQSRPG